MLRELHVEHYAVVERLRVEFDPGLNLLTGETGSGKSIVVDALALLFGARASSDAVRRGARRARVCGTFEPPPGSAFSDRLDAAGIDADPDELIIERHVLATGKSRAYVNGSPATVRLLKELAGHLGDIHGQHEQQTLLSARSQLAMVDSFAGLEARVGALADCWRRWESCREELGRLRSDEQDRIRRADLLRYQAEELAGAEVQAGEDEDLVDERARLANAETLRVSAHEAYDALYDSARSAAAQLKLAADSLLAGARADRALAGHADALEGARATVEDVAYELRAYLGSVHADPARLEEVEDRLALVERLKRKYGPELRDVLEFQGRLGAQLAALDAADETLGRLEGELAAAEADYQAKAERLSAMRREAAARLARGAERQLRALALQSATLRVSVEPLGSWSARGCDKVALLFSANPGQPARPLAQVASGGELSRVALALKTTLQAQAAALAHRRTLVFDEVDAGVGGGVAEAIGRRLRGLAGDSQVLCVTHLPQVACFADAHYRVEKFASGDTTSASVAALGSGERADELARMLSGSEVTAAALENARQLLRSGRRSGGAGASFQQGSLLCRH